MMGPAELTSLGPSGRIATPCARSPCPGGSAHSPRSEEHTSELQSQSNLVCRLLLEKKNKIAFLLAATAVRINKAATEIAQLGSTMLGLVTVFFSQPAYYALSRITQQSTHHRVLSV